MTTIKPELAGGFRDYLPEDMIPRQKMLETIKRTFERFGFVPLDTPAMEKEDVLVREGTDFLIYRAGVQGEENMAMRYDLTVPLARIVAANADKLALPFKRYQFGRVWRGEKQQTGKGRYREFSQVDADIVGSDSVMADAEIVSLIYETLTALGLGGNFNIRVNDRNVFSDLSAGAVRILDKLDKIGETEVRKEIEEKFPTDLQHVAELLNRDAPVCTMALDQLVQNAQSLGVPGDVLLKDNTLARGLGYYTGNVFEAVIPKLANLGSIFSGGRYDNLVARFAPVSIPAVGASVGIDRLFTALDELGLLKREKTTAKVLVLNFDPDCKDNVQKIVTGIRRAGVEAELYLGQEDTLKGQLSFAVKQEYSVVILCGKDEKEKGVAQVKNMNARTQKAVPLDEIVSEVRQILG